MPVDRLSLGLMLRAAGLAAVASAVVGTWLAWAVCNREFPGRNALVRILWAAIALPGPVLSYYLLASRAYVSLSLAGLLLAGLAAGTPLAFRAARARLESIGPAYVQPARSLGAGGWRVFTRIEGPLIWRETGAAMLLALFRIAAELAVAIWLVGPRA